MIIESIIIYEYRFSVGQFLQTNENLCAISQNILYNKTNMIRFDKWLWAARFFKTRVLATNAINGGKIHLNGERIKPSRKVNIGDELVIRQGHMVKTVIIKTLSDKRGPAKLALELYEETEASIALRTAETEQRKLLAAAHPQQELRPNKKQRRQIHRFKNINDD